MDRCTISLYHPPFYTSPHGYRICIDLCNYLNGDGNQKGEKLSIFHCDVFRARQPSSVALQAICIYASLSSKNQTASITETFIPDLNSPSLQKPENNMNIASGFLKFAPRPFWNFTFSMASRRDNKRHSRQELWSCVDVDN